MDIITNKIDLNLAIQDITVTLKRNQSTAQLVAISALAHFFNHSADWQPMAQLVAKLEGTPYKSKCIKFFAHFGNLRHIKDGDLFKRIGKVLDEDDRETRLLTAMDINFWEYKPTIVPAVFNLEQVSKVLVNSIAKQLEKAKEAGAELNMESILTDAFKKAGVDLEVVTEDAPVLSAVA